MTKDIIFLIWGTVNLILLIGVMVAGWLMIRSIKEVEFQLTLPLDDHDRT